MIAIAAGANPGAAFSPEPTAVPSEGNSYRPSRACPDSRPRQFHLSCVAAELLAETHRDGVLQVGAPDLENPPELLPFVIERLAKSVHRGQQHLVRDSCSGYVQRRGNTSLLDWLRFT